MRVPQEVRQEEASPAVDMIFKDIRNDGRCLGHLLVILHDKF